MTKSINHSVRDPSQSHSQLSSMSHWIDLSDYDDEFRELTVVEFHNCNNAKLNLTGTLTLKFLMPHSITGFRVSHPKSITDPGSLIQSATDSVMLTLLN